MDLFNSPAFQYVNQTVLYTAIIAIVIEVAISMNRLRYPVQQIKHRFLVLLLPVIYPPFFFLLYPARTSAYFHQKIALFDSNQWLMLRLGGNFVLGYIVLGVLTGTTIFFLLKEAIPFTKFYFGGPLTARTLEPHQYPRLDEIISRLTVGKGLPQPVVLIINAPVPMVRISGLKTLVLSPPLLDLLDEDELEAVIAHELAHLTGEVSGINLAGMALRFLMFYNPVALLVFRRLAQDIERRCDDIAVTVTGKPLCLSSGLLKVFRLSHPQQSLKASTKKISPANALTGKAYHDLLMERIGRLLHQEKTEYANLQNLQLAMLAGCLGVLLFFVV